MVLLIRLNKMIDVSLKTNRPQLRHCNKIATSPALYDQALQPRVSRPGKVDSQVLSQKIKLPKLVHQQFEGTNNYDS